MRILRLNLVNRCSISGHNRIGIRLHCFVTLPNNVISLKLAPSNCGKSHFYQSSHMCSSSKDDTQKKTDKDWKMWTDLSASPQQNLHSDIDGSVLFEGKQEMTIRMQFGAFSLNAFVSFPIY